jgi:DNA topoisomerase VI subunit B
MSVIERTAFRTSRLLDFVSERELAMQCGYGPEHWPLVAVKELVDNALDACEEQGIAPEIAVTVDESTITVADNGAGIPSDTVTQLLDFSIRVSSREAYVAPDRGAQGNALKAIVAMPFALDSREARVDIVGGGIESRIAFGVDRIQQRPVADVDQTSKDGSLVRIHWPAGTSYGDEPFDQFLQEGSETDEQLWKLCKDFTILNPHLTLTLDAFGNVTRVDATNPTWEKWRPSSPTSPHWYEREHLERLLGAYITHELQTGYAHNGDARTVREFIAGFRGMTSTPRQAQVLRELGLARAPLTALLSDDHRDFDHELVGRLLEAMKARTKPPHPRLLGVIGREHISRAFSTLGTHEGSFEYKKSLDLGEDGLPQVTEIAFAALQDQDAERWLTTGVNWSAAWVNPFRRLGTYGNSLDAIMESRRFSWEQPIALLVHVGHPRVQYSDRGKSTVLAR